MMRTFIYITIKLYRSQGTEKWVCLLCQTLSYCSFMWTISISVNTTHHHGSPATKSLSPWHVWWWILYARVFRSVLCEGVWYVKGVHSCGLGQWMYSRSNSVMYWLGYLCCVWSHNDVAWLCKCCVKEVCHAKKEHWMKGCGHVVWGWRIRSVSNSVVYWSQ